VSQGANAAELSRADLGARVRTGLAWKIISEGLRFISRTLVAVVLARTLGPHDFGIAGMALILSSFVVAFADLGLGGAVVQAERVTEVALATVFWTSVAAGVLFSAIGVLGAGAFAAFFHEPRVAPLVQVLSLTFLITSLGSTHRSLLARAMDFRNLELRFLAGVLAGAGAGVAAALAGFGPWALIIQEVVVASVSTALLWILMPWRPRIAFSSHDLRSLGLFGVRSVGGSLFVSLNQNADNLLVGKVLGAAALGIYSLAYSAILMPLTRIVTPIQQVLYPAFSRLQDDPRAMANAWLRSVRMIAAVVMPLMFGLVVCAPDVIPAAFGSKWTPAVPVVQVLALASIVQCLVTANGTVLLAVGAARTYLRISAVSFAANLVAFVAGLHWGVLGVATAYTFSSTALAVVYTVLTTRTLDIPVSQVPRALSGVTQSSVAMLLATVALRFGLPHRLASEIRVGALVAVGAMFFAMMLYWRDRRLIEDSRAFLHRRLGEDVGYAARAGVG
jgi:O-antigen/teichoic acid export membrane protein